MGIKKLYYIDKEHNEHFVKQNQDLNELFKYMNEDINKRHLKCSEHTRNWVDERGLWIDFGSWTEFYLIEGATLEDLCK